jgi:hypothetical protein
VNSHENLKTCSGMGVSVGIIVAVAEGTAVGVPSSKLLKTMGKYRLKVSVASAFGFWFKNKPNKTITSIVNEICRNFDMFSPLK